MGIWRITRKFAKMNFFVWAETETETETES